MSETNQKSKISNFANYRCLKKSVFYETRTSKAVTTFLSFLFNNNTLHFTRVTLITDDSVVYIMALPKLI